MSQITNDEIVKRIMKNHLQEYAIWLQTLSPEQNIKTLKDSCSKVIQRYRSLVKNRSRPQVLAEYTLFMNKLYEWPKPMLAPRKRKQT